jgi:hypothetical protein
VEALQTIQSIALAPDGRTIAMLGMKEGERTLFLRDAGAIEARPLARPADPTSIVFSPDGASLGVVGASGELWEVSPANNEARVVARASTSDVGCPGRRAPSSSAAPVRSGRSRLEAARSGS